MTEPVIATIRRRVVDSDCVLPDSLHPVLRRVLAARGVRHAAELEYGLGRMLPLELFDGVKKAADLLAEQLHSGGNILVLGDFDADGATSCALAVRALRAMGAANVDFLVPNRFEYGYGLTPEIVEVASEREPGLIMTVDNGISSVEGVAAARELGIPVLITDHHLPGGARPEAAGIVNPNLPENGFPSKHLAGVGVTFYVMCALRAVLRSTGWFTNGRLPEPNLAQWLDLVALGTVADVVPFDYNNRILVHQGLRRIRAGRCCPGISALIAVAGRVQRGIVATDLGFAVGPRINAAGRLDDMSLGVECLLSDDAARCARLAQRLDELNRERRAIEAGMQAEALNLVEDLQLDSARELPAALCLYQPDWHPGVIGILASRVKARYHRPVIAFARESEHLLRGSARSVPGLHIRDLLDTLAARRPDLLQRFGGHAMAAGLSLSLEHLREFGVQFECVVRDALGGAVPAPSLESDGELGDEDLGLELAEVLRESGPWGQGFPEPRFDGMFRVVRQRMVGGRHLRLVVEPMDGQSRLEAIAFNQPELESRNAEVRMLYRLDVNEYRGERNLQLVVEQIEAVTDSGLQGAMVKCAETPVDDS